MGVNAVVLNFAYQYYRYRLVVLSSKRNALFDFVSVFYGQTSEEIIRDRHLGLF